jgi:hypothetical protein
MIRQPGRTTEHLTVEIPDQVFIVARIIQQKPLQVNHQYDAQSKKQKREAL